MEVWLNISHVIINELKALAQDEMFDVVGCEPITK